MTRSRPRPVLVTLVLGAALVAGCDGPVPGAVAGPTTPVPAVTPTPTAGSTGSASPTVGPTPAPTRPPRTAPPRAHRYVFPVSGNVSYAREHHDYPATDIIAACGSPVRAVTDGVVLEVSRVDRWDPATDDGADRGGLFVSLAGDDGVRYYGAHLRSVAAGVRKGVRVTAGEIVGRVGDTGRSGACHLHLGLSPPCARVGDWWVRRGVVPPWSYLDSWRKGGRRSPVSAVTTWRKAHGCPDSPGGL
jgi:murein DD-endopeptidase MepM/ murein hydrolase activator NlpD